MKKTFIDLAALLFLAGAGCNNVTNQTSQTPIQQQQTKPPAIVQSTLPAGKIVATSSDSMLVLHTNQECQVPFYISDPKPYQLDSGAMAGTYYTVVYGNKRQLIMEAVIQTPSEYANPPDINIDNHFSPEFITSNGNIVRVLTYPTPPTMNCQVWLSGNSTKVSLTPSAVAKNGQQNTATLFNYKTDEKGNVSIFDANSKIAFVMEPNAAKQLIAATSNAQPDGSAVALANDPSVIYLTAWQSRYNQTSGAFLSTDTSLFAYSTKNGSMTKLAMDSNKDGDSLLIYGGDGSKIFFTRCNVDWSPGEADQNTTCPPGTEWFFDVNNTNAGILPLNN